MNHEKLVKLSQNFNVNINYILTGAGSLFLISGQNQEDENVMIVKLKKGQVLKVIYEE